jgi:hypothetical protein
LSPPQTSFLELWFLPHDLLVWVVQNANIHELVILVHLALAQINKHSYALISNYIYNLLCLLQVVLEHPPYDIGYYTSIHYGVWVN